MHSPEYQLSPHDSRTPTSLRPRQIWRFALGALLIAVAGLALAALTMPDAMRGLYRRVRAIQQERLLAAQISPLTVITPGKTAPATVRVPVAIAPDQDRHSISPLIYGMAFAPLDYVRDLRLGLNRWGGNDKTRYNWVHGNAVNAARDWRFANRVAVGDPEIKNAPSAAADWFVRENKKGKAETLLTVPTIGWVARDTDNTNVSRNVPTGGGPSMGANGAIAGYDPTENRTRTSVPSFARRASGTPAISGAVYQDEWIAHLKNQFGAANKGGVRLYAMDNEPDLWDGTHTDIHPAQMGYDDLLAQFLEYARAVKSVDSSAQVTGPVSWGWTGYHYSPLDRGNDNYRTHADRKRHGGEPLLLWFLKQVRASDTTAKSRSLDVLDVHYYPQEAGLYGGAINDASTRERRVRATRSLWDPSYTDESWIAEPISLLPLLRRWIAEGYPGTRVGITEWNFGGESDISGGLAVAETLGIYGREDVYLANYWAFPPKNSPAYLAFKLYRNSDGNRRGFGDISCRASSENPELVSSYAATDSATGALTLMLINKMPQTTALVPLTYSGKPINSNGIAAWRLDEAAKNALRVCRPGELLSEKETGQLTLPPYSVTLVRLPGLAKVPVTK
ncbi:MAG: glycoside hydrolase family 44 protein [Armatimonadota bacterium]